MCSHVFDEEAWTLAVVMMIHQKIQYATPASVDDAFSQSAASDLKAQHVTSANKTAAVICFGCRTVGTRSVRFAFLLLVELSGVQDADDERR